MPQTIEQVRQALKAQRGKQSFKNSANINSGATYDFEVEAIRANGGRKKGGGDTTFFIAEMKVRKVVLQLLPAIIEALPPDKRPNFEGQSAALKIDLNTDWGGGKMWEYLTTLTRLAQAKLEENDMALVDDIVDEATQPCKGLWIRGEAYDAPLKGKAGSTDLNDYRTRIRWTLLGDAEKKNEAHLIATMAALEVAKKDSTRFAQFVELLRPDFREQQGA